MMRHRWITASLFVFVIGAAPALHLLLGSAPSIAVPAWPPFAAEHYRSGAPMRLAAIWFREATPASAWLRGARRSAWWELGWLEPAGVRLGDDGWMFAEKSLQFDPAALAINASLRRTFLRQLRARCEQLGVHLLAAPVPDKTTVYAAKVPAPRPDSIFSIVLGELAEAGIDAVDLRVALTAAADAGSELYYRRDTHWNPDGMQVAAAAIEASLQQLGWLADAGPAQHFDPLARTTDERAPDLVVMLGLPSDGDVERSLRHPKWWLRLTRGGEVVRREQPGAAIAVCGDSFAFKGLFHALASRTDRLVDSVGSAPAVGPFQGLLQTLERIERGELAARVVVWEFVERSYRSEWHDPPKIH